MKTLGQSSYNLLSFLSILFLLMVLINFYANNFPTVRSFLLTVITTHYIFSNDYPRVLKALWQSCIVSITLFLDRFHPADGVAGGHRGGDLHLLVQ